MKDHIIVCGTGETGQHVIKELFAARVPVVAIDADADAFRELREDHPSVECTYIVGDATDDDVLERACIATARGIAATLPSDKDNLFIVVSARQSNPGARILARVTESSHADKLK